ncbi:hypothetical protein GQ43DRAFT_470836 [Delitschia confertaspora ATCC 74209]|uniref:Uncharacterized protein n=1 Tax=Delitschia confertaspora ATCC 74209 TaxID=1513339 RepID=A0A9P4MR31_9PLEO|nr:hypothetical protein GQ43DRAFT_470836 [Delitschia confertaspora ATCC 74209]
MPSPSTSVERVDHQTKLTSSRSIAGSGAAIKIYINPKRRRANEEQDSLANIFRSRDLSPTDFYPETCCGHAVAKVVAVRDNRDAVAYPKQQQTSIEPVKTRLNRHRIVIPKLFPVSDSNYPDPHPNSQHSTTESVNTAGIGRRPKVAATGEALQIRIRVYTMIIIIQSITLHVRNRYRGREASIPEFFDLHPDDGDASTIQIHRRPPSRLSSRRPSGR